MHFFYKKKKCTDTEFMVIFSYSANTGRNIPRVIAGWDNPESLLASL